MLPGHYNEDEAATQLEAIILKEEAETEQEAGNLQLSTANLTEFEIMEYEEPKCWRLSMVNELTREYSPVRMRIQGVICDMDLPPVRKPANQHALERMRPHLRQAVKLTGLESGAFQRNVEQLEHIQVMFSGALPPDSLKDWSPTYECNNLVIDMHNRFFTKRSLAPNAEKVHFDKDVDPNGILDNMQRDGKYIHTKDNRVYYFGAQTNTKIEPSPAKPTLFRPGDIVDVSVEFAAFPSGANNYTTVVVLRGIRMLSCDLRNKAAILEMRARYRPMPKLKRKSTDGPGEVSTTERADKRVKQGEVPYANHIGSFASTQVSSDVTLVAAQAKLGETFACTQASDDLDDLIATQELFVKMQVSDPHIDP